jgi:hypothetical protein
MVASHPFSSFTDTEVRVALDADRADGVVREVLEEAAAAPA